MTIGFFFILVGTLKLTPAISEEVYREMRKTFIRDAKVFPFNEQTGFKPDPHVYRKFIGVNEVVCGLILALVPGPLKQLSNIILFLQMCGAVYTHYALKEGMDKMTPALVFGLLLGCRYIVHLQVRAREQRLLKEAAAKEKKAQ